MILFPILKEKKNQNTGWRIIRGSAPTSSFWKSINDIKPKILMLDEPTAGVSPIVMDELFDRDIIESWNKLDVGILMVEQNAKQALSIC